jgi:hypothetical protein
MAIVSEILPILENPFGLSKTLILVVDLLNVILGTVDNVASSWKIAE